jgi:hypothetical protein
MCIVERASGYACNETDLMHSLFLVYSVTPGGGKIFRTFPDRPWGPPSLLYNGYWSIPVGKAAGAWC